MKDQFKRILELVRKTGDTMVVTDTNGNDVYVVMDLDQYEMILEHASVLDELDDETFDPDKTETIFEDSLSKEDQKDWQIPEEFIIDDPEGGLTDDPEIFTSDKDLTANSQDLDIWTTMQPANESGPTWDLSQMNTSEIEELEKQYKVFADKNIQQALSENKKHDLKPEQNGPEDNFSEEQFYLEPIE